MSELKVITQAQLLTTTRDLRDRVEISLHKLGPGAKAIQTNLNNIVATLSVQNAHPVDDKQPSLFDSPRVGQPTRKPKRKLTLDQEWQKHKAKRTTVEAERTAAGRTNTLKPKPTHGYYICSKCSAVESERDMIKTAGRRWVCKKCNKTATSAQKKAPKKVAKRIKPQAAFMAPMQASSELAAIVGTKPQPRTDVTKKVWDYIKKHGLQDKKNKRNINVDEALGKVFANKKGVVPKQVSMFEMTKLVTRHLTPVKQ